MGTPGLRFQQRYQRNRDTRPSWLRRFGRVTLGVLVCLAGLLMLVAPGPGLLALLVGAGLMANESLTLARFLDRAELWIRSRARGWRTR